LNLSDKENSVSSSSLSDSDSSSIDSKPAFNDDDILSILQNLSKVQNA